MTRMIVGFDPSQAQAAIAELRNGLVPGVEWRVLNLDQNPNGVEPARPEEVSEEGQGDEGNLLQRLTGWLGKASEQAQRQERKPVDLPASGATPGSNTLELSEEELTYLRHAPARAATVIVVTAPDSQDATVRTWSVRNSGFSLAPARAPADKA